VADDKGRFSDEFSGCLRSSCTVDSASVISMKETAHDEVDVFFLLGFRLADPSRFQMDCVRFDSDRVNDSHP